VIPADDPTARHSSTAAIPTLAGRSGNINGLTTRDLFTLEPGEREEFVEWVGTPGFPAPGRYKVVFYYANEPSMPWKGLPLPRHDPEAMRDVQRSVKCSLVSNELLFIVIPPVGQP